MAPKLKFTEGEKVLCFHGPLLYEAKCIKSQLKDKVLKYFIHYSGWNKNWDEWVPESRVLKYNEANMQKQKELETAHGSILYSKGKKTKAVKGSSKKESSDREATALPPQEKTPKQKALKEGLSEKKKKVVPEPEPVPAATPSTVESPADLQRKKRTPRAEQNVETEEEYIQKIEVKIRVPEELKHWLVDDWNLVTRQKKMVQLPARVPIETIISDYIKQKMSVKGMTLNKEIAIVEATNGIREYFNIMIGRQLLYNFERPQFAELMAENPDSSPSHVYGAIHLLRLFTKVGGAIAYTALDEESVNMLSCHIYDFLKYISKSSSTLLSLSDYYSPPQEYVKKAG